MKITPARMSAISTRSGEKRVPGIMALMGTLVANNTNAAAADIRSELTRYFKNKIIEELRYLREL